MALTPTTFKARWTEFAPTSDGLVQSALDEAARRCDARLFGADRYDDAVSLYAAHLLSVSPQGAQARLEATRDDAQTTYGQEWQRLAQARCSGPWTVGQRP